MVADVEKQLGMLLHLDGPSRVIEGYRAVCWDHGSDESKLVANWYGEDLHGNWIDAAIEVSAHNLAIHSQTREHISTASFEVLLEG